MHNGLPALAAGISLAFGSTPASLSFAGASIAAGGVSLLAGPAGWAIGAAALGSYALFKVCDKNHKELLQLEMSEGDNSDDNSKNQEKQKQDKAPGKPTENDGYIPPKRWDGKKVKHPKTGQHGWPDDKGKVWVPTGSGPLAHGGPHWDVIDKTGNHINIMPGGKIRG